ncbi:MAG: efflux RND transporter permease subunit [Candidatus Krumholzibacteriia bacterium]
MTLPELAIKRPVTTVVGLLCLLTLGVVAVVQLPLAFMPDIREPELFVQVSYPSASPEQIEQMIVRPLEDALGSVKGLKDMWARCGSDGARMRLGFDWGADLHLARVEIWERIDRIRRDLPEDIGDIMVSRSWGGDEEEQPILEGRLSSKLDLSASYDLLERKIIRPLERVPGVATVSLDGVNPREVRVNLRPEDLQRHNIDVREVSRILRGANFDQSLGRIDTGEQHWALRTVGTFGDVAEIANLPLRADGLRLSDVADVQYSEPPLEYGRHLDGDFAVGVSVSQESKANTVEVCAALKERIAAMGRDPELEGVNFITWFSQGDEITKALRDLAFTGVFGSLLASLVLFVFLRRLASTFFAVLCIPLSLVVALGVVWARGGTLNTLVLLGLIVGVGMLVDNAVVIMENIFRYREQGMERREAALRGSREVTVAVTAATMTSVIVMLPLVFNKPTEMNLILRELGLTVVLTLLASLFVSQTLIPLAMTRFIRSRPRGKSRPMLALERGYGRVLAVNLRHRWLTPIIGLGILASTWYPFTHVDKSFGTSEAELFVQLRVMFTEEVSLDQKRALISRLEDMLEPHRAELQARAIYSFWSDRWSLIRLYPPEGKADEATLAAMRTTLRGILPVIPGVELTIQENAQGWHRGGGRDRIFFNIVGDDTATLNELAEQAVARLQELPGLFDVNSGGQDAAQELHINVDRELASIYGMRPDQVGQMVGLTFRGRRLPRFRTPDGEREMRLALDEQQERSVDDLANLPLYNDAGQLVPLASVADLDQAPGALNIQRNNRLTNVGVSGRYSEGTSEEWNRRVAAVLDGMDWPLGYRWTYGPWQDIQREQSREMLDNILLALLLVFAVMAGLFESVAQAVALMVALPFALAGAFWTLYLTGTDLDQPAAIGLLLLIGIVVNNGIVMLEHINQYRRGGMERMQAMLQGGRERLRPVVMTALTTVIGLVPIVVQKPSLGGVYYYSMALVIMGGLVVSTFLTTILLPTTATLAEDATAFLARLGRRRPAAGSLSPGAGSR